MNTPMYEAPKFRPIGSGNRENPDQRVSFDKKHGDWPDHVDLVVRLPEIGAHKIRVNDEGQIISEELT